MTLSEKLVEDTHRLHQEMIEFWREERGCNNRDIKTLSSESLVNHIYSHHKGQIKGREGNGATYNSIKRYVSFLVSAHFEDNWLSYFIGNKITEEGVYARAQMFHLYMDSLNVPHENSKRTEYVSRIQEIYPQFPSSEDRLFRNQYSPIKPHPESKAQSFEEILKEMRAEGDL